MKMYDIHTYSFFQTTPSLGGFPGSPEPNSVTLSGGPLDVGAGGKIRAVTHTFNDREHSVAVAPGQEGVPRPPGLPLPGARPARQPRRPRPGLSARHRRHPPEPSRQPRSDTARAGRLDPRGPQTHHGRRAANAPTAGSHKAPATPVVLVTPAERPAPSLRWARETAIG